MARASELPCRGGRNHRSEKLLRPDERLKIHTTKAVQFQTQQKLFSFPAAVGKMKSGLDENVIQMQTEALALSLEKPWTF